MMLSGKKNTKMEVEYLNVVFSHYDVLYIVIGDNSPFSFLINFGLWSMMRERIILSRDRVAIKVQT